MPIFIMQIIIILFCCFEKIPHEKAFILKCTNTKTGDNIMTFDSSKNLGGVGAILMFIGVFPYINYLGIVELIGAILILVALHGFASIYKQSGIFDNALYGIIAGIVGVVLAVVTAIAIVLPNIKDFILKIYPSWNGDWSTLSSLSGMTPNTSNISFGDVIPFITAAIVIFRNTLDICDNRDFLYETLT